MDLYEEFIKTLPKRIINPSNDYVQWTATTKNKERVGRWKYTICYSPIMSQLGEYEIRCIPFNRYRLPNRHRKYRTGDRMGPLSYLQFMHKCQTVNLIPSEIEFFHDKKVGNCMVIPRAGWDRHTVYTALSLYRHLDCRPRTMSVALSIHRKTKLPWLQVLHYILSKLNGVEGHTFIDMTLNTYGNKGGLNPGTAMALCAFSALSLSDRDSLPNSNQTCTMFKELTNTLNPLQKNSKSKSKLWFSQVYGQPTYLYPDQESILDPKYSPLYTDSSLETKDLQRIMKDK